MNAIRLRTEHLYNPIGIDIIDPRLYWNCENGIKQTAYHIIATDDGGSPCWDSGKINSDRMAGIVYGGHSLESRTRIRWKVRLWDENDTVGPWSETAFFEMGLLHGSDWQAKWITGDYIPHRKQRYPVDCFRRVFVQSGPIARARLYITACGVYEAHVNGQRAGCHILSPGFTDYRKRLSYQTIDVTALIREGDNDLTVWLADGWYRGSIGAMGVTYFYGKETKLLAQLEITDANGQKTTIVSNDAFAWSNDGPLTFADLKDGEICDMRKTPTYSQRARVTDFSLTPCAANNVPVVEREHFTPTIRYTPSGKALLDFGQNIAGYLTLAVTARAGQTLRLRMAEHLDQEGELDMASIQCRAGKPNATPQQTIHLVCAEGENRYKTRFAVFGFRYAEVETDIPIEPHCFTAIAVYSAMEEVGRFDCSHPLINRFVENTRWSMKGNFLDVPTDCPTRERAGWTGDAQIFSMTGGYLMDTAAFFRKWLRDLRDRQTPRGKVHCIVPSVGNEGYIGPMDGCCGWADAAVLVPWDLYTQYGDRRLLEESYASMKAHVLFSIKRCGRTGLLGKRVRGADKKYISNTGQGFGEWLEPPEVYRQTILKDMIPPHPEEATAYLSHVCGHMVRIAHLLGHTEDIALYEEYRDGCRRAYVNQFTSHGRIETERQAKLVRPLALGLLEGETETQVFAQLIRQIEKRDYRIGTGFLSTPLILPLLTRLGRVDIAYKMMENEAYPGWLYQVKEGATTVWENWNGSASQNHYSAGSVCRWLFEDVCGIRVAGENHFDIAPQPGGTLTHAGFHYNSLYGRVSCRWEKTTDAITYDITVPAGTTATVRLPGRDAAHLSAGTYRL